MDKIMNGLGLDTLKDYLNLPANDAEWDKWARENGSLGPDYDYSKIGKVDNRGHGSDKGKLPNHPTFSTGSEYSEKGSPGKWLKTRDGRDYFEPSKEQVAYFGREYYNRYSQDTGDNIFIPIQKGLL